MDRPVTGYQLRALNAGDTAAFLALKQIGLASDPASFVASPGDDAPDYRNRVRQRLAVASIETGDIVIGKFGPELVGIIAITHDMRSKRRHKADFHGMYIVAEHCGRGIGKRLLIDAWRQAINFDGLGEIQLNVAVHNHTAVELYGRFGIVHASTENRALKNDDGYVDAHTMTLNIRRNPALARALA